MIPRANITAWRTQAPWALDEQVEQDLVLSRALSEIFARPALREMLAFRGGTALHKLFFDPPGRYSEDLDLVQVEAGPIKPVLLEVQEALDGWLGSPRSEQAADSVKLVYGFETTAQPVRRMRVKIEINTREHFTVMGLQPMTMEVASPWFSGTATVQTYQLNELMGTKLRALYQRRKGRDLFDLWLCLSRKLVDPARVAECFLRYMEHEKHPVSRAQFEQNLHDKQTDAAFMEDIAPLLSASTKYDPSEAVPLVHDALIARLPGDPWRGTSGPAIER